MIRIWLIDDVMSKFTAEELFGFDSSDITVSHPEDEDFSERLNDHWDLILVDEELWDDDTRLPTSAVDGASLVACLRSWARINNWLLPPVAMLTNHETAFKNEPPAVGAARPVFDRFISHESVISPVIDVEWLFSKHDKNLPDKVKDLAESYVSAKDTFGKGGISFEELKEFLGPKVFVSETKYHEGYLRKARPPINESDPNEDFPARGQSSVLSWLLRRALPFPGLFVSDFYAAHSLGIRPEHLDSILEQGGKLFESLRQCIYSGPLSTLMPRRWWTSSLDQFASKLSDEPTERHAQLRIEPNMALSDGPNLVVCIDQTLCEVGLIDASLAVRVRPPNWPNEAMQPWMSADLAKSEKWLLEWIDENDRMRVND